METDPQTRSVTQAEDDIYVYIGSFYLTSIGYRINVPHSAVRPHVRQAQQPGSDRRQFLDRMRVLYNPYQTNSVRVCGDVHYRIWFRKVAPY